MVLLLLARLLLLLRRAFTLLCAAGARGVPKSVRSHSTLAVGARRLHKRAGTSVGTSVQAL